MYMYLFKQHQLHFRVRNFYCEIVFYYQKDKKDYAFDKFLLFVFRKSYFETKNEANLQYCCPVQNWLLLIST